MFRRNLLLQAFAVGILCFTNPSVFAQTLKVGLASEPTALDPHYWLGTPNLQITNHIFDPLVAMTPDLKPVPALAQSYRLVDDITWEFKLRKNVKFHNGADLNANSVVFTLCRIPTVPNSPGPYTLFTGSIVDATAPDPHTVILKTRRPNPLLPTELSYIGIISDSLIGGEKVTFAPEGQCKIAGAWPTTADFNSGKVAFGTGPYKFTEYVKGDYTVLKRNDGYWGKKPEWDAIRFRNIPAAPARSAALLSGDVDFIESPPVEDALRFGAKDSKYKLANIVTTRVIFLGMDLRSDTILPADVKGTDGKNPFRDQLVREALSMAIDRRAIANGVMKTFATPAEQMLAKGFFGTDPLAKPLPHDPDGAKKLLAQAGYPNGFEVTLAGPNDRYVNDQHIMQAIAQMWTKIGVKTNVNAMTKGVFFSKVGKNEFGIWLIGWGAHGDMSSPLQAVLASKDKDKGYGTANRGGHSDPVLDRMLDQALVTMNENQRQRLLREASKHAMDRLGVIPLHHEISSWAMRKGIDYKARADQQTFAFDIVSVKPSVSSK